MAANLANPSKNDALFAQESSIADAVSAPEARFECPICLQWLRDPVLTSCGHRFCRNCIQSWLERENPTCPVDNMKLQNSDIFPDNFTRREISQHRTKCPNIVRGCYEELSPLDVELHLAVCKFKPPELPDNEKLRCTFVDVGCDYKFEDEPERQRHLEQEVQKHLALMSQTLSKIAINNPANTSTSAIAQQANFWDPPSKTENASSYESNDSVENLIKSLYEKIVILEQKNREQDIIIANMSEQISANNLVMTKLALRYCNGCYLWYINDFKNKINVMRNNHHMMHYSPGFYSSPNGYKLCIRFNLSARDSNYIAVLIHMMKTDHDSSLDWPFSGRITVSIIHPVKEQSAVEGPRCRLAKRLPTSPSGDGTGYKEDVKKMDATGFRKAILTEMEPRIIPEDWPDTPTRRLFAEKWQPFRNIKETMMTRPELDAFKRPVQDLNPKGFGYTEFALLEDIVEQGFIDSNQLLIKVNVQPV